GGGPEVDVGVAGRVVLAEVDDPVRAGQGLGQVLRRGQLRRPRAGGVDAGVADREQLGQLGQARGLRRAVTDDGRCGPLLRRRRGGGLVAGGALGGLGGGERRTGEPDARGDTGHSSGGAQGAPGKAAHRLSLPSSGTKLISRAQRRRGEAVVGGQPLVVIGSPEAVADGTAGGGPSPGGVGVRGCAALAPPGIIDGVMLRRRVGAGVGIGLGVGASVGAGAAGLGWFYSSVLLDTSIRPVFPERVLAVSDGEVTLAASRLTAQPGIWGLRWATDRGA